MHFLLHRLFQFTWYRDSDKNKGNCGVINVLQEIIDGLLVSQKRLIDHKINLMIEKLFLFKTTVLTASMSIHRERFFHLVMSMRQRKQYEFP